MNDIVKLKIRVSISSFMSDLDYFKSLPDIDKNLLARFALVHSLLEQSLKFLH